MEKSQYSAWKSEILYKPFKFEIQCKKSSIADKKKRCHKSKVIIWISYWFLTYIQFQSISVDDYKLFCKCYSEIKHKNEHIFDVVFIPCCLLFSVSFTLLFLLSTVSPSEFMEYFSTLVELYVISNIFQILFFILVNNWTIWIY